MYNVLYKIKRWLCRVPVYLICLLGGHSLPTLIVFEILQYYTSEMEFKYLFSDLGLFVCSLPFGMVCLCSGAA